MTTRKVSVEDLLAMQRDVLERDPVNPVQVFTDEHLERCRATSTAEILVLLEQYRLSQEPYQSVGISGDGRPPGGKASCLP